MAIHSSLLHVQSVDALGDPITCDVVLQLVENWWGHIQVHEPRLGGKKTPIGRASPENGGNQYIGIEDSLHLSRLMENVIHKSLAFFLRHPPEIHPTGPAYSFELFAILIDESVKTLQPPQELS